MPAVVNEIVEVSYRGICLGQRIMLVTHWRITATQSANSYLSDMITIANWFARNVAGTHKAVYLALLGPNYAMDEVRAQVVSPSRQMFASIAPTNNNGTAASDAETPNLQGAATLVTNAAGRRGTATYKLGPLPTESFANGILTAGQQTAMGTWVSQFVQPTATEDPVIALEPGIWHRPPALPVFTRFEVGRVHSEVRTMSRRTVGRGI